jgi:cytochrome P450
MTVEASPAIVRLSADFLHHPHELFARLRREGPARPVVMPHGAKVWLITRYADVRALLTDPRISKDGKLMNEMYVRHSGTAVGDDEPVTTGFDDNLSRHLLNSDPPEHTRLRAQVSEAFSASRIACWRPRIEQVTDELLNAVANESKVDLIRALAVPLPLIIIAELHGIPAKDRDAWQAWSTKLIGSGHDPVEVAEASRRVTEYTIGLLEAKRAAPGDDLVSALVNASDHGDGLNQDELVAMIFVLMAAGLDTPMRQIGVAVYTLLTHPSELAKLRADPSLMPSAVDELMRFDGTVAVASFRFAVADIPLDDVIIPAGEMVLLSPGSADRDSAHFDTPDQLDVQRHQPGSLAFGHGPHYCIGAHLAKLEIEVALSRLISRFPHLRLAVDPNELHWENHNLLRSLEELPVLLTPPNRAG